jgi:uncharacterized membrane protein YgdD (TMEM256/DUF423 family)
MRNREIAWVSILGAVAVGIGAFGAHGLKDFLIENGNADTFETAVKYFFYHIGALAIVGFLPESKYTKRSALAFKIGMAFFSGSLFLLCITNIKILGAITPVGGLFLIAGWLLLFFERFKA